jgi:predicted dehydrogenase
MPLHLRLVLTPRISQRRESLSRQHDTAMVLLLQSFSKRREGKGVQELAGRLGVGIAGSGFVAKFHVDGWKGIREADIKAIYTRNERAGEELAAQCRKLRVGDPVVYTTLEDMIRDENVDAIWVTTPNYLRVETAERIAEEVSSGRARLAGVAFEKPLARNLREARSVVDAIKAAGLLHGYLENQLFVPAVRRGAEIVWSAAVPLAGPPYLARGAEEHAGPHKPWFWKGSEQGGGVLNDMMCHTLEATRHLLTKPSDPTWLTPRAVAASIGGLKWTRPRYAQELLERTGGEVDYRRTPSEDYARAQITYETRDGDFVVAEATTSWGFVGAGLRLSCELLGPEYSMAWNTLDTEVKLFLSRAIQTELGEALVEKQNADTGLLPLVADEAYHYGYQDEDRHMVEAFVDGRLPEETLDDGLLVTELMMTCYLSAELGETLAFPVSGIEDYVPQVQVGEWEPAAIVRSAKHWSFGSSVANR